MIDLLRAGAFCVLVELCQAPVALGQDQPESYRILPEASLLQVHTYKGGLLGTFGHEHDIRAHAFSGTVIYHPRDASASHVAVTVRTDSLFVVPANDSSDIPDITRAMREEILHVDSFPEITFTSTAVEFRDDTVHLRGDVTMVGQTQSVEMDLVLQLAPPILHVQGEFTVKQTDFGIRPYSTALGTVKVKNEITFVLDIRAIPSF
jgi:polyisoprenoid-binding protein YceI